MAPEQVNRCHLIAMPYPGRGHINPMMNFCKLLSSKMSNVLVSFVVTEEWLGFLSTSDDILPENIRFTTIPNVIPSEIGRGKDFPGFIEATITKMRDPFERLLDQIELDPDLPPPSVILYDFHLIWPVDVGNIRNIPVACFFPMSAMVLTVLCHFDLLVKNGHFPADVSEGGNEVIDYIPGLPSMRLSDLPTFFHGNGREVIGRVLEGVTYAKKSQYLLLATIDELESDAIAAVKSRLPIPAIYSIGPVIPYFNPSVTKHDDDDGYLQWLTSHPKSSVLYISQGSFLSASTAQMDEIIAGIRDSGVPFLWVARGEGDKIRKGCGDKGLVVPWCDQLRVLCHDSVGGFWSHCGWNSTKEGMFAGVPFLTYPIFWDQMTNSKMITTGWGIGWQVVKKLGMGSDQLLVRREDVADLVRRFMDLESQEGKETRRKAEELRLLCGRAVSEGGSVQVSIDDFVRNVKI
ncbi:UDP-glycosyltransferase 87A2-like [Impatiens glandulifera]|uniref:UDP-glycosyltransferase 87A2-like n=1 Tax=Impatiens glandulifera TaxID=253017 RepID=UPI001FB19589|nr:UDP-glycosyltransferase 87A2-like [Impatiens glandulifera]